MKRLEFLETKRTPRYSLRKFSVGMVSVLLGVTIFGINFTNHSVKAATESVEGSNSSANSRLQQTSAVGNTTAEQTNTQKTTRATGKVQQSSASNNATANNSTEAATTSQSAPKTQGSADTDIKSSTARSAATNLVTISGTDRNAAAKLATMNLLRMNLTQTTGIPDTVNEKGINDQPAKKNQSLANKTNLTSSDNYSSNIYKDKDGKYYKIVTINGHDYVYRAADIQASGADFWGYPKQTAEDTKNNISISKEDLGNGKTRWTVVFFPHKGLQNVNSDVSGLISAKFGIALTSDYKIVGNVDMEVISDPTKSFRYYTFEKDSTRVTEDTLQNPTDEVDFSFNPKTDVDKNTGLINSKTMPAYNNKYLQGPYYFTTGTPTSAINLWQTYFKYADASNNAYDRSPYVGNDHSLNFNIFKIANKTTAVDGAKYNDPIIYDKRGGVNGVFSSDNFTQAMEFKSQGKTGKGYPQFSTYVISFTTQHTDSHEVGLATGSKNQQFSGISANIYSNQDLYYNMYSSLYGEQRALNAKGDPLIAEKIIPNWNDAKAANKAIDDALVNKKGEINTATNIDQATKDNLIKKATDAAGAAKNAIGQATTVDEIKKAKDDGINAIEAVKVPSLTDSQTAAKQAIDDALNTKKSEINGATNLDQTTKDNLIKEATAAATTAKDAIDKATTNNDVATEQTKGTKAIDEVKVPSLTDSQTAAKQAIDDALNTKKSEINGATNLDQTTKDNLIKEATAAATTAKDAIDKATTNNDVATEQTKGTKAIDEVKVPSLTDSQTAAKQAIDQAAKTKDDAIDASNLTAEEKDALKKTVAGEVQTAKDNIDDATKDADVTTAQTNGEKAINAVEIPTTSATKADAINAINTALADKKTAINGTNLTAEEKSTLVNQAQQLADDAIANINKATTNDAVKTAKDTGVETINNINVPTTSATKDDAINAINAALTDKKAKINGTNLTDEEKIAVINKAQKLADDAIADINKATTNDAVNTAKENGVQAIKNMTIPTVSDVKKNAKNAIDKAAKTKDNAIDASNLTTEEKDALKKKVAGEVKIAKDNIDAATKDADVTTAQTNGEKAIKAVEIPTSSKTKNDANSALDTTADAAKKAIDKTSGLTDDQKQTAKDQIDQVVDAAKENIKNASDNKGIADATAAGKLAIDKVSANAAIDDALAKKIEEINKANLTDDEKSKLTTEANTAAKNAKDKIQAATTNDGATQAGKDGVAAIEAVTVPTDSDVKKNANSDLDKTAAAAKNAIDETSGLTADQKQTAKGQIDKAVTDAKENIKNASDNKGVADATAAGKLAIDKISAKAAIDDALVEKNKSIDTAPNLTDGDKRSVKAQAKEAADKAKSAINTAQDNDAVKKAQTDGVNNINGITVPADSSVKKNAKDAIDKAAKTKDNAIDASNLTAEEKDALKQTVAGEVNKAKAAIDAAKKNADVKTAQTAGEQAINAVEIPASVSRTAAINAINAALTDKKAEINGTNLTAEEKTAVINKAQKLADAAIADINKATINDAVNTAKENGVQAIKNMTIPTVSDVKKNAKNAIDQAAKTKDDAIDASNLTAEEKDALKKTVAGEVQTAKAAIDAATKDADVKTVQTSGEQAINAVEIPASVSKTDAINAINTALADKKTAINGTNLTAEEKSTLVSQAQKLADDAIANINKATTNDAVNTAKENGVENIKNMPIPTSSKTKNDANSALDTTADAAKKAIDKTSGLTDDQKQTAKDQIDQAVADAKENIKKASDDTGVAAATDAGKLAIDKVSANAAIDGALAEKNNSIDAAPNLTVEEKQAVKEQANKAADNAKSAINTAQDNDAVKKAQTDGVNNINGITVPTDSDVKKNAKEAIDQAAKTKDNAIDASNLTAEEKADLKKKVAGEVKTAKDNIDAATKDAEVKTAQTNGDKAINAVEIPASASKTAAINAINTALADKKTAINGTNLTAEEKSTLVGQAQKLADDAIANINKATTNDAVNTAKNTGVETINNVNVPATSATKDAAINAINTALADKKTAINGTNLTAEEKSTLVSQAQKLADDAIANINKATTNDAVKTAKETGVETINNVNVPATSATKDDAIKAIKTALEDKKAAIKGSNLTDEEKAKLTNDANTAAGDAITNINQATTNDAVNTAKGNGVQAIKDINVPTTSATKDDAIKAIKTALEDKKAAIKGSNLTDEEKAKLTNDANTAAGDAITNINQATTNDAVNTAKGNGVQAIKNMTIPTVSDVKKNAKNAIDQAAKTKDDAIDASNLTAEEKDALKKTVAGEVQTAKDNIDAATKDADVTTAKNTGVGKINNIKVPDTSATKDDANKAIDDALAKKIDEINKSNLTDEEKAKLTTDANAAANNAKANIQAAKTNDAVNTAKENGVDTLNNVKVPDTSATKDDANKAIDDALAKKIDEINKSNLTDEEKAKLTTDANAAANNAKANIQAAKTNDAVNTAKENGVDT
ncbi:LEA family epithelial adhesin, partial [Lactobacillus johnsonii]|uniref:LEA family epithelial adhesin n=1 Tax=Lactobacillus johnsonii TaxID=33959 RepID=UPI00117A54B7